MKNYDVKPQYTGIERGIGIIFAIVNGGHLIGRSKSEAGHEHAFFHFVN
jgi:hypothetical protein